MYAYFTEQSRTLPDEYIDGEKATCMIMNDMDEDVPMAWDASWSIEGESPKKTLVIEGHCGPNGYGKCTIHVPMPHCPYYISVNEGWSDEVANVLLQHGYRVTPEQSQLEVW